MVGINPVSFHTDFYILPARFRIFGQIRIRYGNTGYQIRNRDGNGLTVFPIVFGFPIFVRDIPLLPIRDIPFFLQLMETSPNKLEHPIRFHDCVPSASASLLRTRTRRPVQLSKAPNHITPPQGTEPGAPLQAEHPHELENGPTISLSSEGQEED